MVNITGKAPVTWAEWAQLWQHTLQAFGFCEFTRTKLRELRAPAVILSNSARSWWRKFARLRRIRQHLDECHERRDRTLIEAEARLNWLLSQQDRGGN